MKLIISIFLLLLPLMTASNISKQAEKKIINSTCKNIGFTEKTEAFGDCYLNILKEVKKSEKRKQQSLALFESKVKLTEKEIIKIKANCENLGFQPKTENYGECFLKLRSKTKLSKRLKEIGINTSTPDYINAISINKEEIKPIIEKCQFLGFENDSDDFASCTLSLRSNLVSSKMNQYVDQHLATKKSNEALLLQQQQQAQINANAAKVASAMSAKQQNSNANSADALEAIFFLLQIGLTLYTLGAFSSGYNSNTGVVPQQSELLWFQNGTGWNPLNLNQIPM
ncbi:hypothetical protein N9542_03865 [Methylophilaceae bacterium]|nr:hypothetical protein [Methylophilaceae bacterium]